MDSVSEKNLDQVHPALAARVRVAAVALAERGIYFRVAQGLRTYDQQNALWEKGRDAQGIPIPAGEPGHGIVTNARGGYSNHNFGCAVDCYPFVSGATGPLEMTNARSSVFLAMVDALKAQGLAWGGDWHSIPDAPHFQLADVPVTPTAMDRATYARGGLLAVWAAYTPAKPTTGTQELA